MTEATAAHLWAGREFGRQVLKRGLGQSNAVYCFSSAGMEILQASKREGRKAYLEQTIAPKRIESLLLEQEQQRFPDWESSNGKDELAEEYAQREQAEWQAADAVLCGSEFVCDGIRRSGGPVEKCLVVPYGIDSPVRHAAGQRRLTQSRSRLHVLTVGTVGLRKGSPYVLQAAKRTQSCAEFRMVGELAVTRLAQVELQAEVHLTGPVPRSETGQHFEWADVFLLPSLCEGSATVTYEALAHGLPVICTPNTGSVVRDGLDGFLVPPCDAPAIIERLERLARDRSLIEFMSRNAARRALDFNLEAYGCRLLAALTAGD